MCRQGFRLCPKRSLRGQESGPRQPLSLWALAGSGAHTPQPLAGPFHLGGSVLAPVPDQGGTRGSLSGEHFTLRAAGEERKEGAEQTQRKPAQATKTPLQATGVTTAWSTLESLPTRKPLLFLQDPSLPLAFTHPRQSRIHPRAPQPLSHVPHLAQAPGSQESCSSHF